MLFHPEFRASKERRLIFDGEAPAAPAEGGGAEPPAVETLTEKQKEVKAQIEEMAKDPDLAPKLVDFQVQRAEESDTDLQARYHEALTKAANAYYEDLTRLPGETDVLKKVNDAFQPARVAFQLDAATGKLILGAEAPAEAGKKGRELTDEEQTMIDEAFSDNPNLKAAAERLMSTMEEGSPELAVAQGFFENFNARSPAERKSILTNEKAFQAFLKSLPPEQQGFVSQLRQTMEETSNELSDEEREDILGGAKKELEKFDATKASEIDKNIMLARMQMRGIDTSNPDGIFKKPPELKVFEGSPMERGFNKIMGLIGYILLNIQKLKDMMHPGEKGAGSPAGDKGKTGPEASPTEAGLQKEVKEKDMLRARQDRQNEIDRNKKLLDGDPAAAEGSNERLGLRGREVALKTKDAQLQAKAEQLDSDLKKINKETAPADFAAKEREIAENKTERDKIAAELKGIQEQKASLEARTAQLTTELQTIEEGQKRTEALRQKVRDAQTEVAAALSAPPLSERAEAKAILAALKGIRVISPAQADEHFTVELWGDPEPTVDLAKFNAGAEAVKKLGANSVAWALEAGKTLKDPEAFATSLRQALDMLKTKPGDKPAAAPAPAPAGPAPAGGAPAVA